MTTVLGIALFSMLLAAATIGRVVLFARGAAAHGWSVQRGITGVVLRRSDGAHACQVALPYLPNERRAGQRWCMRVDGALRGVPDGGLSIHRPGRGPNVKAGLRVRKVDALQPGGAVARARDEAVARIVAADADAVAALEEAFGPGSPTVEVALTATSLEVRARRDRWSFAELDSVCAQTTALAEAFEDAA